MLTCARCGRENPEDARVCGHCGATLEGATPPAPRRFAQTMLGVPARPELAGPPQEPTPASPEPAGAHSPEAGAPPEAGRAGSRGVSGTVIGLPSPFASGAASRPAPSAQGLAKPADFTRTQIGLGAPTVATLADKTAAEKLPAHAAPATPSEAAPTEARSNQRTLLGVARPGIAPRELGPAPPPSAAAAAPTPAPAPQDPAAPAAPAAPAPGREIHIPHAPRPRSKKRPFPWLWVGLAIVAAGAAGGLVGLLGRSHPKLKVASFELTPEGKDLLVVACTGCEEGSSLSWGSSRARFEDGRARIEAPQRLFVGSNPVEFQVLDASERETARIALSVPIAFRVETQLDGPQADPPYASVLVEAPPGATVHIDGKPIQLEDGRARLRVPLDELATGEKEELVPVQKSIPVEVTQDGSTKASVARLRTAVVPLALTTPAPGYVLGAGPLIVSGRTAPHAHVVSQDRETDADGSGQFWLRLDSPSPGPLVVRASLRDSVARTARIELRAPGSPKLAATDLSPTSPLGSTVELHGTVLESRVERGRLTLVLQLEPAFCGAAGPCLARVVAGQTKKWAQGAPLTVQGRLQSREPLTVQAVVLSSARPGKDR